MKNYNKNIWASYLMCLDAKKLYGWVMFQKLPVNSFKWKKMYLNLMKSSEEIMIGKTFENVSYHRDIKLVTTDKIRNQLVSEPRYHTTNWFWEDLLAIEIKKIKVKMNKPVYLGLSTLEIRKALMYEFCYDYIKPKYQNLQNYVIWILKVYYSY